MIFKVIFSPHFPISGKQNLYVSLCENKMSKPPNLVKSFLYKSLYDQKIIDISYRYFSYDLPIGSVDSIRCYAPLKGKVRKYCTLERLKPFVVRVGRFNRFNDIKIHATIINEIQFASGFGMEAAAAHRYQPIVQPALPTPAVFNYDFGLNADQHIVENNVEPIDDLFDLMDLNLVDHE